MATILVVGEDLSLLETRAAVLRTTGAETVCSDSSSVLDTLADHSFDLVVICHSVAEPLCSFLVEIIRFRWPQTRIMRLVSGYGVTNVDVAGNVISSTAPETLILNTKKQLRLIEQAADHSEIQSDLRFHYKPRCD